MSAHLKHHDLQRLSRSKPRLCKNANCSRTLDSVSRTGDVTIKAGKDVELCGTCYGPLYVSQYDPEGKALRRRVERKYLTQLLTGCKQSWCRNEYCKTGREHLHLDQGLTVSSKQAGAMIKPLLDGLKNSDTPAHLCTDEVSQKRRTLAQMLAAEGFDTRSPQKGKSKEADSYQDAYDLEWCVVALEIEGGNLDKARSWLQGFAPRRGEARGEAVNR